MPLQRRPTRAQAIDAAAEIYLEEKLRIETEKAIASARREALDVGRDVECNDQIPLKGTSR